MPLRKGSPNSTFEIWTRPRAFVGYIGGGVWGRKRAGIEKPPRRDAGAAIDACPTYSASLSVYSPSWHRSMPCSSTSVSFSITNFMS